MKEQLKLKLSLGIFWRAPFALSLADHATKLFTSVFPDSTIAKEFKCGCTKFTAILRVIAQDIRSGIESALADSK